MTEAERDKKYSIYVTSEMALLAAVIEICWLPHTTLFNVHVPKMKQAGAIRITTRYVWMCTETRIMYQWSPDTLVH